MIEIIGTKHKEETYGLIAKTWQNIDDGQSLTIVQPNDRGGKSLEKTIKKHFPNASSQSFDKARHITLIKTTDHTPDIIQEWMAHTHIRFVDNIGFYSVPGLFGWNKIDVGSQLLLDHLPTLKGIGADFGCGYGYLSQNILNDNCDITNLYCFDIDDRAVDTCQQNIGDDDRGIIQRQNCTQIIGDIKPLDFIISNPPFHNENGEDRALGQKFIKTMAHHLKKGATAWIVANQHMPYEDILSQYFSSFETMAQEKGFKIFKAVR